MSTDETEATAIGPVAGGRLRSAIWWGALVLVPAVVVAKLGGHGSVILPLGLLAAAVVVVAASREKPTVVTREEVRHPKRTIRRADVTSITRSGESTAFVFRGPDGGVVGVVDVFGRSAALRAALTAHGWPEVEPG